MCLTHHCIRSSRWIGSSRRCGRRIGWRYQHGSKGGLDRLKKTASCYSLFWPWLMNRWVWGLRVVQKKFSTEMTPGRHEPLSLRKEKCLLSSNQIRMMSTCHWLSDLPKREFLLGNELPQLDWWQLDKSHKWICVNWTGNTRRKKF